MATANKTTTKAVAKKDEGGLPAEFMEDVAADAGMGSEEATTDDMTIPFIRCAQSLSDEINKREAAYIDGLEEGDFFNTATEELWKGEEGFHFVPVLYQRKYLGWRLRNKGGGFVGEFDADVMEKTTKGGPNGNADMLDDETEIVVTGTWYGLVVDKETGDAQQCVIPFSKTQLKKSRMLMTKLKSVMVKGGPNGSFNPPLFYNIVHVTSVPESNDQGKWMGWSMKLDGNVFELEDGKAIYDASKGLLAAVKSGVVKAADPGVTEDAVSSGDDADPGKEAEELGF
jgi:hypothetical protein